MGDLLDRIESYINEHPCGCTSTDICDYFAYAYSRQTVTSGVSKLKQRDRVAWNMEGNRVILYPRQEVALLTPGVFVQEKSGVDRERVVEVLSPFAKFIAQMRANGWQGETYVWMSATTETPTTDLINAEAFEDLENLLQELKS